MVTITIYGHGQLGSGVAALLRAQDNLCVCGPYSRDNREKALTSATDVVIIATTTRFKDVAADIETALSAGSNVLVSAEECAYPYVIDEVLANRLHTLAIKKGVSVAGCGVNPGLIFDSLVLTLLGAAPRDCSVEVYRDVDIGGFGSTVLRRIGVGQTREAFETAVVEQTILGHAGFPQSMWVVASALGLTIERIDKELRPVMADVEIEIPGRFVVRRGESAGVEQVYTAIVDGKCWYTARFSGHVSPVKIDMSPSDSIRLFHEGELYQHTQIRPGISAQTGSQNMVANSIDRILRAPPGWLTVADLIPACPGPRGKWLKTQ
ncbi:MAG: hypothetical protein NUV80_00800 [Candidatus Berkelbacteria bacterium]|nr:hypothetical protein [Candidatus Berkelbacteria bacterium]